MAQALSIRRRFLYTLLTLLLFAILAEGGARLAWSEADVMTDPVHRIHRNDPTLFWTLKPGLDQLDQTGHRLTTNSLGLRNGEIEVPKPAGTCRLLSLGESTTWGHGVELEQTYSKVLQTRLNANGGSAGSRGRYEVINAGVGAYSIWQSYVYLRERGLELEPDLILIYHQHNDFLPTRIIDRRNFLYRVDHTDRELYERRRQVAPLLRVLYHSRLYLMGRRYLLGVPSSGPGGPGPAGGGGKQGPAAQTGQRVPEADRRVALEGILQLARARGVPLVVIQPTYVDPFAHDLLLWSFAMEHRLPYVQLPWLRAQAGIGDEGFFLDAVHPTPAGHAFIAAALEDSLRSLSFCGK